MLHEYRGVWKEYLVYMSFENNVCKKTGDIQNPFDKKLD